jgi:putative transposase
MSITLRMAHGGDGHLQEADIKYGYVTGRERFFFVFSIIDVFNRVVVGQYRGHVCEAKHVVETLVTALRQRVEENEPYPIVRTDNGPQFVSTLFGDTEFPGFPMLGYEQNSSLAAALYLDGHR